MLDNKDLRQPIKTDAPVPRIGVRQAKPDLLKAGRPDFR